MRQIQFGHVRYGLRSRLIVQEAIAPRLWLWGQDIFLKIGRLRFTVHTLKSPHVRTVLGKVFTKTNCGCWILTFWLGDGMIRIRNLIDGGSFGTFFPNIQVVKNLPNFVEYMRRREETGETVCRDMFWRKDQQRSKQSCITCFTVLLCLIFLLCRLIVSDKANRVKEWRISYTKSPETMLFSW